MPGDRIVSLNACNLRDVIDFRFSLEGGVNEMEVEREGRRLAVRMEIPEGADPGIGFSAVIFDRIRTCGCKCVFCFVDQLPRGLRKALYLKDDDFRLSFLYGNFTTLNNLREEDLGRILAQRLSPLHVSVHATDPEVRARMMGVAREKAARGLENLRRLGEGGIEAHIQVVLCPGINDGGVLERTVADLGEIYQGVASVGVVPVAVDAGFAQRRPRAGLTTVAKQDCRRIIAAIHHWQEGFRRRRGSGFVYAADEFYLRAGLPLPPVASYDDFPQYENGIGIAAGFREEAEEMIAPLLPGPSFSREETAERRVFLLTGALAAGLMEETCGALSRSLGREFRPLVAENHLFGPHVTVTGLLGGRDVLAACRKAGLGRGDLLLLPSSCITGGPDPHFLDDLTLEEMNEVLDCDIRVPGHDV